MKFMLEMTWTVAPPLLSGGAITQVPLKHIYGSELYKGRDV